MKKAKIILAAIGIIAVAGGAFAFSNAKTANLVVFQYTTGGGPQGEDGCFISKTIHYTTASPTTVLSYFSTTLQTEEPTDCTISVAALAGE